MMIAASRPDGTLKAPARSSAAIRAEIVVAYFFDGTADLAAIASLATAQPVDPLTAWLGEAEHAEMAEKLMGEIHGDGKNEDRSEDWEWCYVGIPT
jgi:hypothetical protein